MFWLSLVPFTTGWMGENHFGPVPLIAYGAVLLMSAIAYWILQEVIIKSQGPDSLLKRAVGGDWKGKFSPLFYLAAMAAASWKPGVSLALYGAVALIWLVPDQ